MASLIFPTLINYEQNKDYLQNVPHRRFLDLAIVYKLSMDLEDGCRGMMTIPNAVLSNLGVSEEDIYEKAIENVKAQNSFAVLSMPEMLFRILDDRDLDLSKEMQEIEISKIMENCNWFVLSSNYSGVGGAAILLFPEIFGEAITKYQLGTEKLLILPSSIHEVIVVPYPNEMELSKFTNMVKEVNGNFVVPEEVLSNSLYYYDRAMNVIAMVEMEEEE